MDLKPPARISATQTGPPTQPHQTGPKSPPESPTEPGNGITAPSNHTKTDTHHTPNPKTTPAPPKPKLTP